MNTKIYEPAEITLKLHGQEYSVKNLDWDIDGDELMDEFKGLMVAAGFAPSIMSNEEGSWEWHEND